MALDVAQSIAPTISVLLPIYNGAQYLRRSIDSILNQTFQDFELIIINDGSIDESDAIIRSYADSRIRYYSHANQGLAKTLNRGIKLSKGRYIARQDQDDVSSPDRFLQQVDFLERHKSTVMVGSSAEIWVNGQKSRRVLEHPSSDAEIRCGLIFRNYFVHSSVLIRRDVLNELGGYSTDPQREPPEDYELWSRVAKKYKLANLKQPLLAYYEVSSSMSRIGKNPFLDKLVHLSAENVQWALGRDDSCGHALYLSSLMHRNYDRCKLRSWSFTKQLFLEVMAGFAKQTQLDPNSFRSQQEQLLKHLRYCYLDSKLGGFFDRRIQNRLRQILKYFLIKK
jgi:glycosyltransferase involved in cell wall biosynthesis